MSQVCVLVSGQSQADSPSQTALHLICGFSRFSMQLLIQFLGSTHSCGWKRRGHGRSQVICDPDLGLVWTNSAHYPLTVQTVVLEKTLESSLDCKEIKPVNPKGNQPWIFTGRTVAETEASILWPPDEKSWLIGKDSDAGKDWRQGEKGMLEDETIGWHHQLNAPEFEQTLGDSEGQKRLECCSPWGHKESDMTEWLNWNES